MDLITTEETVWIVSYQVKSMLDNVAFTLPEWKVAFKSEDEATRYAVELAKFNKLTFLEITPMPITKIDTEQHTVSVSEGVAS